MLDLAISRLPLRQLADARPPSAWGASFGDDHVWIGRRRGLRGEGTNPDPDLVLDLGDKRVNGGHKQLGGKRWVSCSEPRWVPPGTDRPADRPQGLTSVRQGVFRHLVGMERPEPTRLLLRLAGDTDAEAVRELLVREQGCCAFLSFTITPGEGQVVANLQVPADAAPTLDAMAMLAELAASEVAP